MLNEKLKFFVLGTGVLLAILLISRLNESSDKKLYKHNKQPVVQMKAMNEPVNPKKEHSPEVISSQDENTSLKHELEGEITNQYDIRDDILQFIDENIPDDNKKASEAAIKLAQYANQIYYHSSSSEDAMALSRKENISLACLDAALPKGWLKISEGVGSMMRNTPIREKHMWDITEKFFSWQVLGTGLNDHEVEEKCKSGNF